MYEIKLCREILDDEKNPSEETLNFVTPGHKISSDSGFMRGHGTHVEDENIYASVAGNVERISKLISVRPQKTRYFGEVGDVIVGRIMEVQHKRWTVDVNARLNAVLLLTCVNLPGGELRRKTEEDELMMQHYLEVGDLISAEVQSIYADGSLALHTRSLKYGKLSQGTLVKVTPSLIQRKKTHFHNIASGIQIILSNNGYIWISPSYNEDADTGGFVQNLECVSRADREAIARLRNCILALAYYNKMLSDTIILYAYEESVHYEIKDILKPEIMKLLVYAVKQRLELET